MTAFVILAAGRGTRIGRVGESLHKALVPLGGKAVISHLLELAPRDARIIVALGHRGDQIREYLELAHPQRAVTFVEVKGWDGPTAGPGASLFACGDAVGDDRMIFTSCDTLWSRDHSLWHEEGSWAAVAPIPAGTPSARWCRMRQWRDGVDIMDKMPGNGTGWSAYTGLASIAVEDLPDFWRGIVVEGKHAGEIQVSGGFVEIAHRLHIKNIHWTDIGDAEAYRSAVAMYEGYDFTKPDEATYVLPEEGRVVKFWADPRILERRRQRAELLEQAVPALYVRGKEMLAYEFVPGVSGYAAIDAGDDITWDLLCWAEQIMWQPVDLGEFNTGREAALEFYREKTMSRVMRLDEPLRDVALDALQRVDWETLVAGVRPGRIHGDFNFGNVIVRKNRSFVGIDWREDFAGEITWGDIRYDLGKLLAGTVVHWDRAKTGDLRPWPEGEKAASTIRNWSGYHSSIETIGALSLLNCAPLHAAPLDEVLVARGSQWLLEAES